jgi:hypothetical protein
MYDLSNLDLSNINIYVQGVISKDFEKRGAYGIMIKDKSTSKYQTFRTYHTFNSEFELEILALNIYNDIAKESQRPMIINIFFSSKENADKLESINKKHESLFYNDIINNIRLLLIGCDITGTDVLINYGIDKKLEEMVTVTANEFRIYNNLFLGTQYLTCTNNTYFDNKFFDFIEEKKDVKLIQIIDANQTVKDIPSVEKRIVSPLDMGSVNQVMSSIQITCDNFPSINEVRNSIIRRIAMVLRESEVGVCLSSCNSDIGDLVSPDMWFLEYCRVYKIPFLLFDLNSMLWYTFSNDADGKREFIVVKKPSIKKYKKIGYFVNNFLGPQLFKHWLKLIK